MKNSRLFSFVVAAGCAVMFASCASAGTPGGALLPTNTQSFGSNTGADASLTMAPTTSGARIYVSAGRSFHGFYNEIDVYDTTPAHHLVQTITDGISSPNGMAVDPAGNLYVSNIGTATIAKIPPGATKPSMFYRSELTNPLTLAADEHGDLFAVNYNPPGQGSSLFEYPAGSTSPSLEVLLPGGLEGLHVRKDGQVYAGYNAQYGEVLRFGPGSRRGEHTGIRVGFVGCVTFDNRGYMVVCDQVGPSINIYAPASKQPSTIIRTGLTDPYLVSFDEHYTRMYVADNASSVVEIYSYPDGALVGQIQRTNTAYGIAVIPGHQ